MKRIMNMTHIRNWAAAPALFAAASMIAMPVSAAELPQISSAPAYSEGTTSYDPADQTYENHRDRRYRHYRYRRGPSTGDVLAGVLIIGGIAAIANASKRDDRRYRERDRDWRYPEDRNYRDDRRDSSGMDGTRGIDRAVSMCVDEVERESRVETVDRADRTADGWQISGTVSSGNSFSCEIGSDGRIENIDLSSRESWGGEDERDEGYARATPDNQWDDDRYASERDKVERQAVAPVQSGPQPAYPGGPIEGEEPVDDDLDIGTGYPGKST